jgi:hypothetical protein
VIVNVPPWTSSGSSFFSRALRAMSAIPFCELDSDAEVDEVARHDRVAAQLAVHVRMVDERLHCGARHEGEVRRIDAVRGLILLLQRLAGRDDA